MCCSRTKSAYVASTAGNVAATDGLAKLIGEKEFSILFHEGERDNIHISLVAQRVILVVIFAVTALVTGGLTHAPAAGIVLGIIAAGGYYRYDVRRRPKVACRACGGTGDNLSRIGGGPFRRPRGACGHCGGKKGFPRPALRLLDGGRRRKILDEITRAKEAMKK